MVDQPRHAIVALLAEGVDRNNYNRQNMGLQGLSPSSRRAWIEICYHSRYLFLIVVALLAEGVDRNQIFSSHAQL